MQLEIANGSTQWGKIMGLAFRVLPVVLSAGFLLGTAFLQPGFFGTLGLFSIVALVFLLATAFCLRSYGTIGP
jgi:uncharacterized membrane protein YkvI